MLIIDIPLLHDQSGQAELAPANVEHDGLGGSERTRRNMVILRMLRGSASTKANVMKRSAMNQQRKVRLIAVIVANIILSIEIFHFLADEPERFREVYAGAVQMAHPEHRLIGSGATIGLTSTFLEFSADEYSGSEIGFLYGSVSMTVPRYLSKSLPPDTKMTEMLQSFKGGQGADNGVKMKARHELTNLSENIFATAIIELTEPLDEQQLDTTFADLVDTKTETSFLFLSGLETGMKKPIFWRPCAVYGAVVCEGTSSLELYRQWVSRFSWLDGIGLAQLGLNVNRLREAAREGRAYGLLVPETLSPGCWKF
jgi:hypothetical protein